MPGPGVTPSAAVASPTEVVTTDFTANRQEGNGTATEPPSPPSDPAPAVISQPADAIGAVAVVGQVLSAAAQEIVRVVRPDAAVAVATEFGFPLALAAAVLGFLLIQGYVDRRDPKLRMAPQTALETIVQFRTEEQL